jgi:cobalt-zinc-cadmium efflux system membrane fusion protein
MLAALALVLAATSCTRETEAASTHNRVDLEPGVFRVEHPERFQTSSVETRRLPNELTANGTVNPDLTRTIHVTSLASGRVVSLQVRLGDSVKKGQSLLILSSPELSSAMADYQKARADDELARKGLDRAQLLYSHGAAAEKDVQIAQAASDKARADLQAADQRVRLLGADPSHPGSQIDLRAPISGTVVEQNVAGFEGIKSPDNTQSLFTIADLSQVWVVCDLYENDLGSVQVGDIAQIRVNAFPGRVLQGRVGDISRVLDPNTRTAKVRIVLSNPEGILRPGMFVVATFRSRALQPQLVIPASAVMRLHDRDWVFRKEAAGQFRQTEVQAIGSSLQGFLQVQSGVAAGQEVIANALQFSTEVAESK